MDDLGADSDELVGRATHTAPGRERREQKPPPTRSRPPFSLRRAQQINSRAAAASHPEFTTPHFFHSPQRTLRIPHPPLPRRYHGYTDHSDGEGQEETVGQQNQDLTLSTLSAPVRQISQY